MPPSLARLFNRIAMRLLVPCIVASCMHAACAATGSTGVFVIENDLESIRLSDQGELPSARLLVASPSQADSGPPAALAHTAVTTRSAFAADPKLAALVQAAATAHRLPAALVQAVIAVESGYAARAVSPRGARGLMQLMPSTARAYGVTDPFDPYQNINAGARHLRSLLDQFGQDTRLALAAYNAGAGAVIRYHHSIPPFAETTAYVPRVLGQLAQLQNPSALTPQTP